MSAVAEAVVPLSDSGRVLREIVEKLAPFYDRLKHDGSDVLLEFSEVTARLRDEKGALWLRVEGADLAICLGTKTLLTGQLSITADDMPSGLLWIDAQGEREPFAAIGEYVACKAAVGDCPCD